MANQWVLNDQRPDWRLPIATGLTAGGFALLEKVWEPAAVGLAWLALVSVLFTRIDSRVPAPVETLNRFLNKK